MLAEQTNESENRKFLANVLEMEAQVRFRKNMQYFKLRNPSVYNTFKEYTPNKYKLFIDERGYLNLTDGSNVVCNSDPREIGKGQVEAFCKRREVMRSDFSKKREKPEETRFEHTITMNKISDILIDFRAKRPGHHQLPKQTTLIMMLGVGFGYQIEELLKLTDLRTLYLYEPEPDVFYASLYTLDWASIMERFEPEGYSIDLKIGGSPEAFCNHLVRSIVCSGVYRISWFYLFRSATSETITEAYDLLKKNIHRISQGWGFFDDELISLAHGVGNAIAKRNWLKRNTDTELYRDIPVFIIGSGPSIDKDLDFIRENQHKALIFCGGTALKTLKYANIAPDFHVEVERIFAAYELLEETLEDSDFAKDTVLLANNTVHPKVFDLFHRSGISQKVNDAGGTLMNTIFDVPYEDQLDWGKPSCVNGAFVFSGMLGFSNVYLFGCDSGFKDHTEHHSKFSDYYDEEGNDARNYDKDYEENITVDGNFGSLIKTSSYLDMGRMTLEQARVQYPDMAAFNCSDGALIKGFKPTRTNEIEFKIDRLDKAALRDQVLSRHFVENIVDEDQLAENYKEAMDRFHLILDHLKEPLLTPPVDTKDAMSKLMAQDTVLTNRLAEDNRLCMKLLNGSLRTYQTMMAVMAQETPDMDIMREHFSRAADEVIDFIETMRELTTNRFPKLDDYSWNHVRHRARLEREAKEKERASV